MKHDIIDWVLEEDGDPFEWIEEKIGGEKDAKRTILPLTILPLVEKTGDGVRITMFPPFWTEEGIKSIKRGDVGRVKKPKCGDPGVYEH